MTQALPGGFGMVDLWFGLFGPQPTLAAYLAERPEFFQDETERLFISQFAEDMGERFLDDDFLAAGVVDEPTDDVRALLRDTLMHEDFGEPGGGVGLDMLAERFSALRAGAVNSVVLVYGGEVERPRPAQGEGYRLYYVGRFYER